MPPDMERHERSPRPCEGRSHSSVFRDDAPESSAYWYGSGVRDDDGEHHDHLDCPCKRKKEAKLYLWDGKQIYEIEFSIPDPLVIDDQDDLHSFFRVIIGACDYAYTELLT